MPERYAPSKDATGNPTTLAMLQCRYAFALQFVEGKRVLDISCGTGFGSAVLASRAARVTAVDVASDALGEAGRLHPDRSLDLVQSDVTRVGLRSHSHEVVTCFETLEHVVDVAAAVNELTRATVPGGVILASAPNPKEDPPGENPFHVAHFSLERFAGLFAGRSASVELFSLDRVRPVRHRFETAAKATVPPVLKRLVPASIKALINRFRYLPADTDPPRAEDFAVTRNPSESSLSWIVVAKL
jgi:ubiquinone/menaquinone biosynthesis C-methylase UbiE